MRIVHLSDHLDDVLGVAGQHQRATAWGNGASLEIAFEEAQAELRAARRRRSIWQRLASRESDAERAAREKLAWLERLGGQPLQSGGAIAPGSTGRAPAAGPGRGAIAPGDTGGPPAAEPGGEAELAAGLSMLSDDWVMLRNYENKQGDTDSVLIGPKGVWAVEVKNLPIRLTVEGEMWSFEQLDGVVATGGPAIDGRRRCWGRQVSDVAGRLGWWLEENDVRVPVRTAVMILNEQARITRCRDLRVDLLETDPQGLLEAIDRRPSPLDPATCHKIEKLVITDQRYHLRQ